MLFFWRWLSLERHPARYRQNRGNRDYPSGAGIPGVTVKITNTTQGIETKVTADEHGDFTFPSVPVGTYDILFEANGFRSEKRTGLVVDTNADIQQNMKLQLAQQTQELTVSDTAADVEVHVEIASTQMGDVVVGKTMTEVALNGRSFTDLLALQPGIVPIPRRRAIRSSWPEPRFRYSRPAG